MGKIGFTAFDIESGGTNYNPADLVVQLVGFKIGDIEILLNVANPSAFFYQAL